MRHLITAVALSGMGMAAAALWLWPSAAQAYGFANFCCGDADFIDTGSLDEMRNACTIGKSGSVASSYFSAVNFWKADSNLPVSAALVHVASECFIDIGDWDSEIALVNRSTISQFNGLTTYAHANACFCGGGGNYSATDSRIANDMSFVNTDGQHVLSTAKDTVGGGRVTFVHEIGHQLGLNEAAGFDVMTTGKGAVRPLSGDLDSHPQPFPDDISGVRALYGTAVDTNIFTSAQAPGSQGNAVDANPPTFFVCRTGLLNTATTVVNSGSSTVTYRQTVYLAAQPDVPPSQAAMILNRFNSTISPRSVQAFMTSAQGPFIGPSGELTGIFFVLHAVDDNDKVSESDERDNITTDGQVAIFTNC